MRRRGELRLQEFHGHIISDECVPADTEVLDKVGARSL